MVKKANRRPNKPVKKHRRGSMTKEERLAAAPKMALMKSPDVFYKIRRYASWYYVSAETAISELRSVGVEITDRDVSAFKRYRAEQKRMKRERREKLKQKQEIPLFDDSDETYAYIAGYTPWGFPYGVTWEQMEELNDTEDSEWQTDENPF